MRNRFFARNRYLFHKSWFKSTIFAVFALVFATFAGLHHYGEKVAAILGLDSLDLSLLIRFGVYFLVAVAFSLVAGAIAWFAQYYIKELEQARYREEKLRQEKQELEKCISNLVSEHEQRIAYYKHQLTTTRQQQKQEIGELEQKLVKISDKADSLQKQTRQDQALVNNLEQKLTETTKIAQSVPFLRQKLKQAEEDEKYFAEDYSHLSAENRKLRMRNSQLERQNLSLNQDLNIAQQNFQSLSQFYSLQQPTSVEDEQQQDVCETEDGDSLDYMFAFTLEAIKTLDDLFQSDSARYKRVHKALSYMSTNLRHQGLRSHKYQSKSGPLGEDIFECYVDNGSSGAWRIFWYYGPGDKFRTIASMEPHS